MKEEYGYDHLLDIYPYPTLIQLKDCLGGIYHCVTVVGKWIFDSTFPLTLPLTKEKIDYFCINDNEKNRMNGYKGVLKEFRISQKRRIKVSFRSENV